MERSDSSVSSIADSCSNGAIRDQSHRDRSELKSQLAVVAVNNYLFELTDQTHYDESIDHHSALTEESWDVVKDDEVGFKGIPPLAKVPDRIHSVIFYIAWQENGHSSSIKEMNI